MLFTLNEVLILMSLCEMEEFSWIKEILKRELAAQDPSWEMTESLIEKIRNI